MKQFQIFSSDPMGRDLKLVDEEGKEVEGEVTEVTVFLEANEFTRADVTIKAPIVNVAADVREITLQCPCCSVVVKHDCPR